MEVLTKQSLIEAQKESLHIVSLNGSTDLVEASLTEMMLRGCFHILGVVMECD